MVWNGDEVRVLMTSALLYTGMSTPSSIAYSQFWRIEDGVKCKSKDSATPGC